MTVYALTKKLSGGGGGGGADKSRIWEVSWDREEAGMHDSKRSQGGGGTFFQGEANSAPAYPPPHCFQNTGQ